MARNIQSLERAAAMLRLLAGGERRLGLSTSPRRSAWPRAPPTASCAPSSTRGSSSRRPLRALSAGRRTTAPGDHYLDVHELRRARPGLDGRPGPLQRRERPSGRPAPAGRADRAPRLPARRQPSGAGGRGHAAPALHRAGQGPVGLRPGAHSEVLEVERTSFHRPDDQRPGRVSRGSWTSPARGGTRPTSRRPGRVPPRSPPPIHDRRRMPVGAVAATRRRGAGLPGG